MMKVVFFIQRKREISSFVNFYNSNSDDEILCIATEPRVVGLLNKMQYPVKSFADYISPREMIEINQKAIQLSKGWGQIDNSSEYNGYLLSECLEWDTGLFFKPLVEIELIYRVIKNESPDKCFFISDGSLLNKIADVICKKTGIQFMGIRRNIFQEFFFYIIDNNVSIDWLCYFKNNINKFIKQNEIKSLPVFRKSKNRYNKLSKNDKSKIMMVFFRNMPERYLRLLKLCQNQGVGSKILMLDITDKPPDEDIFQVNHLSYSFLGDYYKWDLKKDYKSAKLMFNSRWEKFSENAGDYFMYQGISLFPMLKDNLKKYFLYWFPRFATSIKALEKSIKVENPKLLVGADDSMCENRLAFMVARRLNIQSLLVPHGLAGGSYFLYSAADKIAAFSRGPLKQYQEFGVDIAKLEVTGSPVLERVLYHSYLSSEEIKKYFGPRFSGNFILYLPGGVSSSDILGRVVSKVNKVKLVAEAMNNFPSIQLVVKLHRLDDSSRYDYKTPGNKIVSNMFMTKSMDVFSLMKESRLVIAERGTEVLEILTIDIDKPLVILDLDGLAKLSHEYSAYPDYYEHNTLRIVLKPEDLKSCLREELEYRGEKRDKREEFLHKYGGPMDGKANENIAELIKQMIRSCPN